MKITIEFDGVTEQEDVRSALDGYKWKLAMWDLGESLRKTIKYDVSVLGDNTPVELEYKIAEKYKEMISEILDDYGLKLTD